MRAFRGCARYADSLVALTSHRHTTEVNISVGIFGILQRCLTEPSLKVMIFCAGGSLGTQEIAFPHQCEIKVNGGEVKANLRGLKGKPGSTRPVDITHLLRFKPPTYNNRLEFMYALTNKVDTPRRNLLVKAFIRVTNVGDRHTTWSSSCASRTL